MGRAVELVDIRGNEDRITISGIEPQNQFEAQENVVIKLAGFYAQARVCGSTLLAALRNGGQADYDEAARLAQYIVDAGYAKSKSELWSQAEWEVDQYLKLNWSCVERVAVALEARGTLTAEEFAVLYRS
jgi:hypothetical protein